MPVKLILWLFRGELKMQPCKRFLVIKKFSDVFYRKFENI